MSRRTSALGTKLTALAMSTLLATATPLTAAVAYADDTDSSNDTTDGGTVEQNSSDTAKDEIVYTRTDATGATSGTYVVNYFNTPQATEVSDPGTYDKVTNLSTSEQLEDKDGTVDLTTLAGEPFYYQGDLSSSTQLPWDIEVTYTLDGKEVSPDELSGASGDLDIELKVTGLDDDSATADFAKSFVLQAQGTFPDANFKLSDAGNATVSTVGDNTLVTFLQLPGTDGDYHIKGKATDFNYSGWQVAAMPLSLDVNVDDYDTSQLTDAAGELEDATTQLADGGTSLQDGLSQLNSGASTAASGATTLSNGAATLQAKLQSQRGNFNTLNSGAAQVAGGVHELRTQLETTLPATLSDASTQVSSLRDQTNTIRGEVGTISTGMQGIGAASTQITNDANTVGDDLKGLQSGMAALSTLPDEINTAATSINNASSAASTAKDYADKTTGALNSLLSADNLTAEQKATIQAAIQASSAASQYAEGASNVSQVATALTTKSSALKTTSEQLTALANGGLTQHAQTLAGDLTNLQTSAGQLTSVSKTALSQANDALDQADSLISTTQGTLSGMGTQLSRLQELDSGAQQVSSGVSALTANLTQTTSNGSTTIYGASTQIASGASQLQNGLNTLSAGTQSAYNGSGTLADGLNELRDAVSGMDQKVLDEVQETINEKLGKGYQLHSFVDADNTDVDQVQFVYVVDGVDAKDDKSDTTKEASSTSDSSDDTQDESFTSRLIALFKSDDK